MKKLIKLLLNPKKIIRYGFVKFEEEEHEKVCFTKYGVAQIPTIDLNKFANMDGEVIEPFSFLDGTSMITDIVLLKSLARKFEKCNYLEIGSWRGESIANVASVAEKCTSVTLSELEMRDMNLGQKFIDSHGLFSKNIPNIITHKANSHHFDFNSMNEKFDLIFVDGDHTFAGVLNDTKKVFDLRRDSNSFIVWHDYGYGAETVRYSVLNAILEGIPKDKHKHLYHVSNTMSAIYCEQKVDEIYLTDFPTKPNKTFSVKVSFKKMETN
jgi:hypothetical protein